jgi:PPOX class probable F420-dependent enzyme
MTMIDQDTDYGRRVQNRLQAEWIIWLTTTGTDLTPQPRPVWFYWDGQEFLIYTRPGTHKLDHIARRPAVSLNLDSDGRGGDIVVFTGQARIETGEPPANQAPAFMEKYQAGLQRLNLTEEAFAQRYSVAIRIKPENLRGH